MKHRTGISMALALCVLAVPRPGSGAWLHQRHDAQRTGLARGVSDISKPVKFYRYYLGGALDATQLITYDVDHDGRYELIYVSGGSVTAKKPDDSVIWRTPQLGLSRFIGVADFDGNGDGDVVVYSAQGSIVVSASTGAIEWVEPSQEMGTLQGVAVGDLDGDGLPDLLMQECGCCGVNSGNTGYVYSFAGGFASPTLLYALPHTSCLAGDHSLALIDVDGDGTLEVMNNTHDAFNVLDGATGATLATVSAQNAWTQAHYCRGRDVDGLPGDEILCVMDFSGQPATDQRKITVLKYDVQGPTLSVLWSKVIAPDTGGSVHWIDPFTDLDGDGHAEVVVATKDASDVWSTRLFDAATGAELQQIVGEQLAGTAPIEEAGKSLLLTTTGVDLSAYAYDGAANPSMTKRWTLTDRSVLEQPNWARRAVSQLYTELVTLDLGGDGVDELVTRSLSTDAVELVAYSAAGGVVTEVASYALPTDVDILRAWALPPVDHAYPQLALARADGILCLFTDQLEPSQPSEDRPGIRMGGYFAPGGWRDLQRTPVVGPLLNSAVEGIIVRDSRDATLCLDASVASLANPPNRIWRKTHMIAPAIIPNMHEGGPAVAGFRIKEPITEPPEYGVVALSPDGQQLFDVPLEGIPQNDLLPAVLDQDGGTDLVFQWGAPADTLQQTRGVSGQTGLTLFDAVPIESGSGRQPAGLAVHDWNGDGYDDVFLHGQEAHHVLSGQNGSEIATSVNTTGSYFMATIYDVDDSLPEEITLHGSSRQPRTLSHDLQTELWVGSDDDRPYPYAAVAPCPSGPLLVAGSWAIRARVKVTQMSGPSAGTYVTTVLAGGEQYIDEASALAKGKYLGQLTATSVHENLSGTGRPTALVGSDDGWLYGLDPCSHTLDFALDFGAAVGEVVFGDTDGDGRDEILVTAADGYLHGLKHEHIRPPSVVLDTDPHNGITAQDVDTIVTLDQLHGAWSGVEAAVSYEAAVATEASGIITNPLWTDVGNVTAATLDGLPLDPGTTYFFVVRAISANGEPSVDGISDGVVIQASSGTGGSGDAGAGGAASSGTGGETADPAWLVGRSCVYFCSATPRRTTGMPWFVATLVLVLWRRRAGADNRRSCSRPVRLSLGVHDTRRNIV